MHWSGILLYGAMLGLVIPATFVSRTPLVLGCAWAMAEAGWLINGDQLPIWLYLGNDIICTLLLWPERQWREKIIIAIYPPQWIAYAMVSDATTLWWFLYWTTLAQFIIAGSWLFRRRTQEGWRTHARSC